MAYVSSNPDDETQDEGGPLVPGGAPTPSAPTNGATSAAAGQKPKTSGRFTDLGEYLRVNAPQQFGGQLAGKIGQDVDAAGNQLGQASNEFKSRADAGTVKDDQGLIGQVGTNPEGIDVGAFSKLRDASYGGPTNFSNASDLYNQTTGQANAAESKANASKTEGGRFALLDSYYGKPQYSQGQKSLDNLLVQNDPNSQQAFKQIQDNARALQSNVAQTGNQLSAYGNQAKAATDATRTSARSALGIDDTGAATGTGAIGDLQTSVGNQLKAKQAEASRVQDAINTGTANSIGSISPDIQSILNNTGASYGINAKDYITGTPVNDITNTSVTTPDQQARLRVLDNLAGLPTGDAAPADLGKYANSPLYNFNSQGYGSGVASAKNTFNTQKSDIQNQIKQQQDAINFFNQEIQQHGANSGSGSGPTDAQRLEAAKQQLTDLNKSLTSLYGQYGVGYADPINGGIAGVRG